jgi:MFS transporter, DHA1 family, multidrug resistance protein
MTHERTAAPAPAGESTTASPRTAAIAASAPAAPLPFVLLLTALTALGQFGSNIFLPGLPALTQELRSTGSTAAQAYTVYLLVFGAGQLLMGPLSDRWGRRGVGVVSALLFIAGAAVCALAPGMDTMLLGRALQGLGAAGAIVVGRASARDHFQGPELMRVMATMTIAFAAVPGLAPLLGGVLTQGLGWRSTLWAAALAGSVLTGWVLLKLPAGTQQPLSLHRTAVVYLRTLRDRSFLLPALVGAGAIGAMSAFFGASPRLFIDTLGVSPLEYGLYPPIAVAGFVVGGVLVKTRGAGWGAPETMVRGVLLQLAGLCVLIGPVLLGVLQPWVLNVGMVAFVTGLGLVLPVATAAAMSSRAFNAGQTAALIGLLQMGFGAAANSLANAALDVWPGVGMQGVMAGFTLTAALTVWRLRATAAIG